MKNLIQGSLEYWARECPNKAAVINENGCTLTWKEWNDQADRLADAFARAGLGPNDIVAVRTQICPEWFVVNRALAKLGCMQIGVNWRFTLAEVRYIMEDSGAKAIVFDDQDPRRLLPLWEEYLPLKMKIGINTPEIESVVQYEELIAESTVPARISSRVTPEFILYTSGTTGHPKGVYRNAALLEKRAKELQEYEQDIEKVRLYDSDSRTLITVPLHHGMGPQNAENAHRNGNPVVLLTRFDPVKTLELIMKYKITHWTAVPTMINRIANLPQEALKRYDVSSIKTLVVGTAPVPFTLKQWIISYFGEHCLYEGYGATETGIVTLLQPDMQLIKPKSAGYPYRHAHISIRDGMLRSIGTGEVGEVWAKTPLTIDRYLNQKKLGTETIDKDGYFRTGDVGCLDEDGYLYISDRIKDMIISGGVNIYPAEIEAVLIMHEAIQDVAVVGIPDEEFGEQIKAFCERKPGFDINEAELITFCSSELASYKRPRSIEFVDELPRNAVGKVLKRTLREPYWKEALK